MMYLHHFLGPWPPTQEILIYRDDPRIPMYIGPISKLKYVDSKYWVVYLVEFSMGQLLIRVRRSG